MLRIDSVDGWRPARYGLAEHAATRLPLEGAHARTACRSCHGPERPLLPPLSASSGLGTAGILFRPGTGCTDCHADPHAKRYAAPGAASPDGCRTCHSMTAFTPSLVNEKLHVDYGMKIEGAHRAVPCVACHPELAARKVETTPADGSAAAGRPFLLLSQPVRRLPFDAARSRCDDCHRDPHAGQFAHRGERGRCESCHGVDAFRPADKFDHDRDTSFRLAGAHARVPCASCHPPGPAAAQGNVANYRAAPRTCTGCHRSGPAGSPPADLERD